MLAFIRGARSLLSVVLVGLSFIPGSLVFRLLILPTVWLFPKLRFRLVSLFMHGISWVIVTLLSLGGARFRRVGALPTASPVLVVGNHQALLDICQIALMSQPRVPAFVARRRYARFVPLVSACIRLLGCPIVDPKRDPAGSVEAIRRGASDLPHGLIIFPEGHRSRDGEIRPFRTTGLETILQTRPMPVYLVLSDGLWRGGRFADLLFRVHLIDAVTEAMGPFEPPTEPEELHGFVLGLRQKLVARLAERRQQACPPAPHP